MNKADIQTRIRQLREELETRIKTGIAKIAAEDGQPIPTQTLQNELFSLIYRLSKIE